MGRSVVTEQAAAPGANGSGTAPVPEPPLTLIEPTHGWRSIDLQELWRYRELVYFLAWRDVKVRYKQTALGFAWVVLQPLIAMAIFTLIFGRLIGVESDDVPYPLFVFAGLTPWLYFAHAVNTSSGSLVSNMNLITKVYFPRLVVPLSAVLAGLVDLAIQTGLLVGLLLLFGYPPTANVLALPLMVALAVLTALSISIWLSALDVQYRDVRYAVPFMVQVWMFATPVVYPASLMGERWQWIYGLNPMAGVVEGFRWALLGHTAAPGPLLIVAIVVVTLIFASGLFYFRRMERTFADIV